MTHIHKKIEPNQLHLHAIPDKVTLVLQIVKRNQLIMTNLIKDLIDNVNI